jgi:DNA-binding PadR family transcriptional regulator
MYHNHARCDREARLAHGHFGGERRHRHGDMHHGRRGSGRRRFFDHGDLRLVILQLIAEKPRHGYEVIKAIEEKLGGAYSPSPGVVYPTLTLFEELGYVTLTEGEGSKKLYTVTPEGAAHLQTNRGAVDALFARMAEMGAAYGGEPATQIVRAMENLKTALRLKLGHGALTQEQVRAIAAAIDQTVGRVEEI